MLRTTFRLFLLGFCFLLALALLYREGRFGLSSTENWERQDIVYAVEAKERQCKDCLIEMTDNEIFEQGIHFVIARPSELRIQVILNGLVVQNDLSPQDVNEAYFADEDVNWVVLDFEDVIVHLHVPEEKYPKLKLGQKVLIEDLALGVHETGIIEYLSQDLHGDTRQALARVLIDNGDNYWKPGDFVMAYVLLRKDYVDLVIPKTALLKENDQNYIFVKVKEGFFRRKIQIGKSDRTHVEILSGLREEEVYVLEVKDLLVVSSIRKKSFDCETCKEYCEQR